uniref:Uncharacterized protein n=1 Tax=Timema genevievae TaxID=629358 RepID=A0A7R9PR04_TIMGE|nr:unnamed protein product [Timema genevievae]
MITAVTVNEEARAGYIRRIPEALLNSLLGHIWRNGVGSPEEEATPKEAYLDSQEVDPSDTQEDEPDFYDEAPLPGSTLGHVIAIAAIKGTSQGGITEVDYSDTAMVSPAHAHLN